MNQKELNELRRRWKPDKNAISRIYGCFVNSNKEIMTDLDESLGMMTPVSYTHLTLPTNSRV